jgi:dsRNA-specific ribonuclease
MTHATLDRQALLDRAVAAASGGMSNDDMPRMRELLDVLVRDWLREAGDDADAPAVIELLYKDFRTAIAGQPAQIRLAWVQAQVLDRSIRRLGVQTFALGKQLIDGTVARDAGKPRGEALLHELEAVTREVKDLKDPGAKARLMNDVQEASMEALYAIEGKAMSLRLNHYASDAQAPHVS